MCVPFRTKTNINQGGSPDSDTDPSMTALNVKMRRLSRKKALSLVKELDAFPKVSESYVETSASGGTGGRYLLCFVLFF